MDLSDDEIDRLKRGLARLYDRKLLEKREIELARKSNSPQHKRGLSH